MSEFLTLLLGIFLFRAWRRIRRLEERLARHQAEFIAYVRGDSSRTTVEGEAGPPRPSAAAAAAPATVVAPPASAAPLPEAATGPLAEGQGPWGPMAPGAEEAGAEEAGAKEAGAKEAGAKEVEAVPELSAASLAAPLAPALPAPGLPPTVEAGLPGTPPAAPPSPTDDAEPAVTASAGSAAAAMPEPTVIAAEPTPAGPPPADLPPAAPVRPPAADSSGGLEERFGTRWVIWIGGVALALGGLFLVQLSIEYGFFGPVQRILLAAALSAALVGAGEWLRRREIRLVMPGVPNADIPSVLTAAGTAVAYGTVYASYALYDLTSAGVAFVLLGLVALATLAASLLHGPWLAGLGLVGATVAPLLVASTAPNYWALYVYLAVVTLAAEVLAARRQWRWLSHAGLALALLWALPGLGDPGLASVSAHGFFIACGFALAAAFAVAGFLFGPPATGRIEPVSSGALAAAIGLAAAFVAATGHDGLAVAVFATVAVGTIAVAWRGEAAAGALPVGGALLAALALPGAWLVELVLGQRLGVAPLSALPLAATEWRDLIVAGVLAALFAGSGFAAIGRPAHRVTPLVWAASAVVAPLVMLAALYLRLVAPGGSLALGAVGLAIAAAGAAAVAALLRRPAAPSLTAAASIFASGSVAALAAALTIALDGGNLTVALALSVPGIALLALKWRLTTLRWLAGVLAAIVAARIALEPRIFPGAIGATPIFNWLLYGYGVPAVAFWAASVVLRRVRDDVPARLVESAAMLFTTLLAFWEIRHYAQGGDILARSTGLVEMALQLATALALILGLEWVGRRSRSLVRDAAGLILGALACVGGFLLVTAFNPVATGEPVGGPVVNGLFLAYALPAILAAALARVGGAAAAVGAPPRRQMLGDAAALGAIVMGLVYATLETRRFFHGPVLSTRLVFDGEFYAYPVLWLCLAIGLQLLHRWTRNLVCAEGARALAVLSFGTTVVGSVLYRSPLLTGVPVGGPIVNLLLLAYGLPAILLVVFARLATPAPEQQWVRRAAASAGIALLTLDATLELRGFFHGPVLSDAGIFDAELYLYPVLWLTLAVGLEGLNRWRRGLVPGLSGTSLAVLGAVATVLGAVLYRNPLFTAVPIGGPLFNLLFLAYAVPAILLIVFARLAAPAPEEQWVRRAVAWAAVGLLTLDATLELRRSFHGPILSDGGIFDAELYLYPVLWLTLAIGLESLNRWRRGLVPELAGASLAGLGAAATVLGSVLYRSPLLHPVDVGGPVVNLLLLAYGAPALLIALYGRLLPIPPLPHWSRWVASGIAVALTLLTLTLEVRRSFHGPILSAPFIFDAEQSVYSATWLAFGIVLLGFGIVRRAPVARLASAAVFAATIAKVFLVDLSGLTGIWRALSFIGLGVVLVGIGFLYQRLLFPRRRGPAEGGPTAAPP